MTTAEEKKSEPYATIDRDGVRVHIPTEAGGEMSFVLNVESCLALVASVSKRASELATTQGKLKAGVSLLSWLMKE